jgi:hypothetical protein
MKILPVFALTVCVFILSACKKDSTNTNTSNLPAVFSKFNNTVQISIEGDYVVLKTNGLPDHKSPYYLGTSWEASLYEAYNGTNPAFALNPNRIASQNLTFKIPIIPAEAATHEATPMGPMGISVNGLPIFNQYAAGGSPLTAEINSFDQYNGHPQMSGMYHYHIEPLYLTALKGKDALIGFLLDGFPIYGPKENGNTLTNADLDMYHGHVGATVDYPSGIYHYHITADAPYINGSGFWGTKGTVTQ